MTDDRLPDDKLPIVFKLSVFAALRVFVLCALAVVGGIAKIAQDGSYTGWLIVAVCLPFAISALVTIVRRCPTLTLDQNGIFFSRCFGSPVDIPWDRYKDVKVRRARVPVRGRTVPADLAYAVTKDGKEICVGNFGASDIVADAIRRTAARMKSGERHTPRNLSASS